jgi:hypothetical protein
MIDKAAIARLIGEIAGILYAAVEAETVGPLDRARELLDELAKLLLAD